MAKYIVTVPDALDPLIHAYAKALGHDAQRGIQDLVDVKVAALVQVARQREERNVKDSAERASTEKLRAALKVLEER